MVVTPANKLSLYETVLNKLEGEYHWITVHKVDKTNLYSDCGCKNYHTFFLEPDDEPTKTTFDDVMEKIKASLKPTDKMFISERFPYAYCYRDFILDGEKKWDKVVFVGAKDISAFREM